MGLRDSTTFLRSSMLILAKAVEVAEIEAKSDEIVDNPRAKSNGEEDAQHRLAQVAQ